MSRSNNSIKNISIALLGQGFGLIISFIARIIFIRILGTEYLGLNGLFSNILTMLSLAELGIGEAITFSLYKPLACKDEEKTCMLMQFYKKVYILIGVIILIVGIAITPFLSFIITGNLNISENINLIYILFVLNTALSYFFSYKRNLIIADQKRYIASIYRYGFYFLLNLFQVVFLIVTKNYIVFLLLQIVFTLLENIFISKKADKIYAFLDNNKKIPLNKDYKNIIIKNTKAMLMHKVGGILVSSTDNIILTKYVSLNVVGLYSNYYLIISALNTIIGQVFNSMTASVGNLFATENEKKSYEVFKKVNFLSYWIYSFSSVCLICLFNDFISIWLGKEYLFDFAIVLVLTINYFITGLRKPVITFKEAAGLFYKDRWKSLVEAIINIVVSIVLAKRIGTLGVFLGTFISSVSVCVWVEPFVVYKHGFKIRLIEYFKTYFKYCFETIFIGVICYFVCKAISNLNVGVMILFILKIILCFIISNICLYIIYHKSSEFIYFKSLIIEKVKSIKLKIKGRYIEK